MEPLEIVSHTDQVPLQGNLLQSTQRELLKTQNPLNNPNDRFDACLAGLSSLTPSAFSIFLHSCLFQHARLFDVLNSGYTDARCFENLVILVMPSPSSNASSRSYPSATCAYE